MDGWLLASPCAAAALRSCFFSALTSDRFLAVCLVVLGRSVAVAEGGGGTANVESYEEPSCDDVDAGGFCSDDVACVPAPRSECCGFDAACCEALSSAVP